MDKIKTEYSNKLKDLLKLRNELDNLKMDKQDEYKKFLLAIINVIDTFEQAEEVIKEHKWNDSENSVKIINRYSTVAKALKKILSDRGVSKLEFPENRLIIGFCKVADIFPDPGKADNTIVSIIREGYIHGKELIREAEVVIVKN